MRDYEIYELGDVLLQSGDTLPHAVLAYKTYGTLNAEKNNVILYPTWFAGQHTDNEWLIGPGKALDPEKYFIIIPNMLGNGLSSSPSNTPLLIIKLISLWFRFMIMCGCSINWLPKSLVLRKSPSS